MGKLAGVKYEKDAHGKVKKVILDMKYHARFIEDYLDHLKIEDVRKDADYVAWEDVKAELDKKHEINSKSYKVVLNRKAEKQLKSLSKTEYAKIRAAIDRLASDPRGRNSIKLTDTDNEYRLRVGDFRILYTIEDYILIVCVFEVVNRKDAYK